MAWFKQEAADDRTYLPNGHRISLDFILDDTQDGYLATENGYVVNQIRTAINNRTGGWVEITEGAYLEAVKKKANPSPSKRNRHGLTAGMFQARPDAARDAARVAEIVAKPDPISVPTAEQMKLPPRPRVGKLTTN